jgi:hypothetical protein
VGRKGDNEVAEMLDLATKLAALTKEQMVQLTMMWGFRDILLLLKVLISRFGEEEAKRLFSEARHNLYYQSGREKAEQLGNPQDMDSFIEAYLDSINKNPLADPVEVVERTKSRAVWKESRCTVAEAWTKIAQDPALVAKYGADAIEAAKAHCVHDIAWATGFNPKIRIEMTKFLLAGDDCCQWVAEL